MTPRLLSRVTRNQADLRADSATVRYDLDMLFATVLRYVEFNENEDIIGMNMAIESFAIHCRAMIHFLFGHMDWIGRQSAVQERLPIPRPTDLLAHDYHAGWQHVCPPPTPVIGDAKWRADKHVAHLTTDRRGVNQARDGSESVWDMRAVVTELGSAMARFLGSAPPGNFDAEQLRAMESLLAAWIRVPIEPRPAVVPTPDAGHLNDQMPAMNITAKTDARTTTPAPAFYFRGTTE